MSPTSHVFNTEKIIRLITFSKHLAHTEHIKSLNIIPLDSLYYHGIGLLMYKLSNGLLPEALNELYIKKNKIHHNPTRNCDKYYIQKSTDSFSNVSARIWNVITTNIDVNISFMQCKIVFKLYLHENELKRREGYGQGCMCPNMFSVLYIILIA